MAHEETAEMRENVIPNDGNVGKKELRSKDDAVLEAATDIMTEELAKPVEDPLQQAMMAKTAPLSVVVTDADDEKEEGEEKELEKEKIEEKKDGKDKDAMKPQREEKIGAVEEKEKASPPPNDIQTEEIQKKTPDTKPQGVNRRDEEAGSADMSAKSTGGRKGKRTVDGRHAEPEKKKRKSSDKQDVMSVEAI